MSIAHPKSINLSVGTPEFGFGLKEMENENGGNILIFVFFKACTILRI